MAISVSRLKSHETPVVCNKDINDSEKFFILFVLAWYHKTLQNMKPASCKALIILFSKN